MTMTPEQRRELFTFQERHGGETYPFFEDENCFVTGYGHQDKAEFAAAVNRYEVEVGGVDDEDAQWSADDISRAWVREHPDNDELLQRCLSTEAGAFPVTTLWGPR